MLRTIVTIAVFALLLFASCITEPTTGPQIPTGAAPPEFFMKQNYPNPFSDTTNIAFGVPNGSSGVRIFVFDRFQQEVRTIVSNNSHPAGSFVTRWDGKDKTGKKVPAGLYYIELRGYIPQATIITIAAIKL